MHEVVLRRYRKLLENGGPFPDLILIDGGKGQLSSAYAALEELGLGNLVAVGIAKKEELLFTRDREDPIALAGGQPGAAAHQRIRDEAHRFAVTFHRLSRTKRDLRSELDACRRHRAAPAQGAADGVRQPRRRAPRDARGADQGGRREVRRRRARPFRRAREVGVAPRTASASAAQVLDNAVVLPYSWADFSGRSADPTQQSSFRQSAF